MPGPVGEVPRMPTKIFLLTSMYFELRCQCPMVTPASLGANGCAQAVPAVRVDASNRAVINVRIIASLLVFLRRPHNSTPLRNSPGESRRGTNFCAFPAYRQDKLTAWTDWRPCPQSVQRL